MRVVCLTPYQPAIGASTRYRIGQYTAALRTHGIMVEIVPFVSRRLQSILYKPGMRLVKIGALIQSLSTWLPKMANKADLFFIQREAALIGPPLIERWLSRRHPIMYDFDDAIFLPTNSAANGRLARWARPLNKTMQLVHLSHTTLAGNEYLASFARQHSGNVHMIPTTVDCDQFKPRPGPSPDRVPTIGWIGSHSTAPYLEMILPALRQLARTHRFRMLIVGASRRIAIESVECINQDWDGDREISGFQALDIGLYPLPKTDWSLGKCGLKAIQYGAVGIPCVSSPVGVNADIVRAGETGLFATTPGEWHAALGQLLDDASLRQRMGAAAREYIVDHYGMDRYSGRLASLMKETVCAASTEF